jgi:hypothetical protein
MAITSANQLSFHKKTVMLTITILVQISSQLEHSTEQKIKTNIISPKFNP